MNFEPPALGLRYGTVAGLRAAPLDNSDRKKTSRGLVYYSNGHEEDIQGTGIYKMKQILILDHV